MRRGCITLGQIQCDQCHRSIPYAARFLAIDEEDGVEVEEGKVAHYCVECAVQKGYASYKEEKDGKILTFFPLLEQ